MTTMDQIVAKKRRCFLHIISYDAFSCDFFSNKNLFRDCLLSVKKIVLRHFSENLYNYAEQINTTGLAKFMKI